MMGIIPEKWTCPVCSEVTYTPEGHNCITSLEARISILESLVRGAKPEIKPCEKIKPTGDIDMEEVLLSLRLMKFGKEMEECKDVMAMLPIYRKAYRLISEHCGGSWIAMELRDLADALDGPYISTSAGTIEWIYRRLHVLADDVGKWRTTGKEPEQDGKEKTEETPL